MITFSELRHRTRHFAADRQANVAMIFALLLVPLVLAAGMGVDYAGAAQKRAKLDAAADAAALAAVNAVMISQSSTASQTAATNMFNSLASMVSGLQNPPTPTVTITDSATGRTAVVTYSAKSINSVTSIIGLSDFAITGTATASASLPPNIDFYLLLDSSPSMAIAATTAGINTMVANTSAQGGCAFGCHEINPAGDNLGNPNGEDNYQLARNLGVTLRIDLLRTAVQNLMTTAQTTESQTNAQYRMAIYTFDTSFNNIATLTSNLTTAQTQAANIQLLEVYQNGWLTSNNNNNDTDTNIGTALSSVNAAMPTPGNGTNAPGDSPMEFLFLVTDGVVDAMVNGQRVMSPINPTWCATLKSRGIRIAVLYTTYLPLPTNSFYNSNIAPFQPNIGTNLQNCASSPSLYYPVSTDGDITAALQALFNQAVASVAHLTQ